MPRLVTHLDALQAARLDGQEDDEAQPREPHAVLDEVEETPSERAVVEPAGSLGDGSCGTRPSAECSAEDEGCQKLRAKDDEAPVGDPFAGRPKDEVRREVVERHGDQKPGRRQDGRSNALARYEDVTLLLNCQDGS